MGKATQACLVCLNKNVKLTSLNSGSLRRDFELLSGVDTSMEGLLKYLCFECVACVRRFIKFRDKCHRAVDYLQQLLIKSDKITLTNLLSADYKGLGLKPDLSYLNVDKTCYKEITHETANRSTRKRLKTNCIPVIHYSIDYDDSDEKKTEKSFEVALINPEPVIKTENEPLDNNTSTELDNDDFLNDDFKHEDDDMHSVTSDDKVKNVVPKIEEEYAFLYPISKKEAIAAAKVALKYQTLGDYNCSVCKRSFTTSKALEIHIRMHETHKSAPHHCKICNYYYKSDRLLQCHMTEKHMYKYVCKQCPEVNFDRRLAKHHVVSTHLSKLNKRGKDWFEVRPKWLKKKSKPKPKSKTTKPKQKDKKRIFDDYFDCSPINQEEQYRMVQERSRSLNYTRSMFKCDLCFKGFIEGRTYDRHMLKHNPEASGKFECDMCKLYFKSTRKLYTHMKTTHLYKYSCRFCDFVCHNNNQANVHFRWHQNVTYNCSFCDKVFKKQSSRLSHIRVHHPSMCICRICGHSFVTEYGLNCHFKFTHNDEEIKQLETMQMDKSSDLYCSECDVQFLNLTAFTTHLGSSNKHVSINISSKSERTKRKGKKRRQLPPDIVNTGQAIATNCEVCGKYLPSDVQVKKHYELEHPGMDYLKRYMCDVCGYTSNYYNNLMHHIRSHTQEKPHKCPYCGKCFSQSGNLKRHIGIHRGEKPFACTHCDRRFAQKITMKLHIQTVHLKIPHPPWNKKNRKMKQEEKLVVAEAPSCSTQKIVHDMQGDYYNAYVSSFSGFVG